MIVLIIVLAIILAIVWTIYEISLIVENGSPATDKDVMEMLATYKDQYTALKENWDSVQYIESIRSYKAKPIYKTKFGIIFPYYINGVGVVPVWYKSASEIDSLFNELKKGSEFENKKRKSLGLD
jgi:hypothetical protein